MLARTSHYVTLIDVNYPNYEVEREVLAPLQARVEHISAEGDEERIGQAVREADAVMVREAPISSRIIASMKRCKVIVRYGVGVDNIDLDAAKERHIYVANVPAYGNEEVADHALALLMAVARRVVGRDRAVREGVWGVGPKEPIYSFAGKVLGLVGYGRIGKAFHRKASTLGFCNTLVYDPYLEDTPGGVTLVDIETLCRESDVISLHAPQTKENYHLIDESKFAIMKANAILVNTSRGGIVDENALVETLRQAKIFGAGIDVFEVEPPNKDNQLFDLDNVVVTDHTAWYSEESLHDLQRKAAQEVARVLSGDRPLSWVNRWE